MAGSRPLALVAEDTELGRWAIAHALQAAGFDFYLSAGWVESAGWLDRADFAAAVMALSCDRDDVSHIVRHVEGRHHRTRLIVLAAQDDVAAVRRAAGPGVIVLPKPIDAGQVVLAVKSVTEPGAVALGA